MHRQLTKFLFLSFQYCIYREIRFAVDSDDESETVEDRQSDVDEVKEYASLVGNCVSKRMLLYRS